MGIEIGITSWERSLQEISDMFIESNPDSKIRSVYFKPNVVLFYTDASKSIKTTYFARTESTRKKLAALGIHSRLADITIAEAISLMNILDSKGQNYLVVCARATRGVDISCICDTITPGGEVVVDIIQWFLALGARLTNAYVLMLGVSVGEIYLYRELRLIVEEDNIYFLTLFLEPKEALANTILLDTAKYLSVAKTWYQLYGVSVENASHSIKNDIGNMDAKSLKKTNKLLSIGTAMGNDQLNSNKLILSPKKYRILEIGDSRIDWRASIELDGKLITMQSALEISRKYSWSLEDWYSMQQRRITADLRYTGLAVELLGYIQAKYPWAKVYSVQSQINLKFVIPVDYVNSGAFVDIYNFIQSRQRDFPAVAYMALHTPNRKGNLNLSIADIVNKAPNTIMLN